MYSKALAQLLLTRLVPQTHTRTHTQKKRWPQPLLRPPARRGRRAEDQSLPRTCPPRVVFELIRTGHQREASQIQTPASRDQPPQFRSALVLATKPLLCILQGDGVHPLRFCWRQDLSMSSSRTPTETQRATLAALVGDGVSSSSSCCLNSLFTLSRGAGGTAQPAPLSLTGRFWRAQSLVALSLAKTSGKSVDWPGGVVTSRGPPSSPSRGSSLNSAHQTGRATLLCMGSAHQTARGAVFCVGSAHQTARGAVFCVGSAHVRADTHVGNGVGQSEVKVMLALS